MPSHTRSERRRHGDHRFRSGVNTNPGSGVEDTLKVSSAPPSKPSRHAPKVSRVPRSRGRRGGWGGL